MQWQDECLTVMKKPDYHTSIKAAVTAPEAFEKINDVSGWWAKKFKGRARNVGDAFTVRFGKIRKDFRIVEMVPAKKIVWEVTDCHMPWLANKTEWTGTRVVWRLKALKQGTKVDFTHVGLVPSVECYGDCERGWNFFIHESLLKLLTENKGDPQ